QEALFAGMNDKRPPQEREIELDARLTVSDREVLQKKDFAQMSAAEIARAKDAIKRLVLSLDEVKTRRLSPHRRGHIIDMHRSARRLIWLNPLLRFEGFEAKARGIRTILPHVDEFRPIHNLDSIGELCRALSAEGGRTGDPKEWLKLVA